MPKKLTRSKLVKKLDTVFSQYIRLSNADNNKNCICVTCNKVFFWKEIQAGHFMSRKHYSIRWDERNVKPQCVGCNVFKYGEQYIFGNKLDAKFGEGTSRRLHIKAQEIVKLSDNELEDLIKRYKDFVDCM